MRHRRQGSKPLFAIASFVAVALAMWPSVTGALSFQPGDLDPTFGTGGTTLFDQGAFGGAPLALAPSGDLAIVGNLLDSGGHDQFLLARLNAYGSLDSSFGFGGVVVDQLKSSSPAGSTPYALAVQPDGKIVAGGFASDASGRRELAIARFNTDGSLDSTFNGTGTVIQQVGAGGTPQSNLDALALQPDGKILAGGWATDGSNNSVFMVARLNWDGSFDASFGPGGVRMYDIDESTPYDSAAQALAVQPDGKILAAGSATMNNKDDCCFLVARLNPDGTLDSSFGSGGRLIAQMGAGSTPFSEGLALALQPDGKVVVGGRGSDSAGNDGFLVARLNTDGSLDSSFGSGGDVRTQLAQGGSPPTSRVRALALLPNGKILAAGGATDSNGKDAVLVARLNSNGGFDPRFRGTGSLVTQIGPFPGSGADGMALEPGGEFVISGATIANSSNATGLFAARLFADVPPVAGFTALPFQGVAGLVDAPVGSHVTFTALKGSYADAEGSYDPDGTIASYAWAFGDGAVGSGTTVTHAYTQRGHYQISLTVVDDYGLADTASETVEVFPPDTLLPPGLHDLVVDPDSSRAARRGTSTARSRKTGATVSYREDCLFVSHVPGGCEAETVTFMVLRAQPGVKRGNRCVRPSSPRRRNHAQHCTRTVPVGSFSHNDKAAPHTLQVTHFHFTGRVHGHKLRPGKYQLTAIPRAGGTTGTAATTAFRIIR